MPAGVVIANGKDDHGGSLLIADLPRLPEPGDVLKGVAQHELGGIDGHVAHGLGGRGGALLLLPADLPRLPEVVDKLAVASSRLAAIRAGESQMTAHLSDEAWLAWLEGLGSTSMAYRRYTWLLWMMTRARSR